MKHDKLYHKELPPLLHVTSESSTAFIRRDHLHCNFN